MFNDVDETLKQYFTAELPISPGELDVSFERPTREWSGRLSRPTLNCFMYDIRERKLFRDEPPTVLPNGKGGFLRQRAAPRIDLTYMITAWAREAEDEHRILARTLAAMYRSGEIPERHFQGALIDSTCAVLARIETSDHLAKPADMWGVLDNELHTSLVWVITAPLEAFAPAEGPIVRTRELRFGEMDEPWRETSLQVEVLSEQHGRIGLIARGVHGPKKHLLRAALQPLQSIRLDAEPRGELGRLIAAEALDAAPRLTGDAMLAAFYINELVLRLAPRSPTRPDTIASLCSRTTDTT